jgi:hypothetical protein
MMENVLIINMGKQKTCGKKSVWFKFSWCNCMVFEPTTSLDYDQLIDINAVKQVNVK